MDRIFILLFLLPLTAIGDAGNLGSAAQGPVPLSGVSTSVEMLSQDVLIEVSRSDYRITGGFLFYSPNDEGDVYMYFPVDVITPFISSLYSAMWADDLMGRVSVSVNGRETEVFPLVIAQWRDDPGIGLTWETALEELRPLYREEPDSGDPAYFTRMPSLAEFMGSEDPIDSIYPVLEGQAVNAAWKVDFSAADTLLVEYAVTGSMTTDYESTKAIICYPLQTGSTWAGNIGRGRVTAVPSDGAEGEQIAFAAGVMMPPPEKRSSFVFRPLEELARTPWFGGTQLSGFAGRRFDAAYEWNFSDFEPEVAPTGWRALYPGLGDMYALIADSLLRWRAGELDRRPGGWGGSFIYLYLADHRPKGLTVISGEGLPLRTLPHAGAEVLTVLPVTSWMEAEEWRDGWVLVRAEVPGFLGDDAGEYTGWVELDRTGEDGLVLPTVLPML